MMEEYTIKQIAEILEVSKPTAQKIADKLEIEPVRTDKNNTRFYSSEDAERIIADRKPDFDFAALQQAQNQGAKAQSEMQNLAQSTAKVQNQAQNLVPEGAKTQSEVQKEDGPPLPSGGHPLPPFNLELEQKIEQLQQQINILLQQREEESSFLKEQLRQKDKQIESLQENLKMAQQLAAADKQKLLLLEAKQQEKEEIKTAAAAEIELEPEEEQARPPEKKKGFWQRLFGL